MRFEDLSGKQRGEADAAIRDIVKVETKRGRQLIDDDNASRRISGSRELTNGSLASLRRWPTVLQPEPYSGQRSETIRGRGGNFYALERGEIGYLGTRAQWTAKRRALDVLTALGLNELEAERELYRWFLISFGVAAVVRGVQAGMQNMILVGARSMEVGSNQGRLSMPAGFIKPTETLSQGFARELGEEAPGLELAAKQVESSLVEHATWTFGPHNVAPSLTFCATITVEARYRELSVSGWIVRANNEWLGEVLLWVTEDRVRAALAGDLTGVKSDFASCGINIKEGFAADVAGPLLEQLDGWHEGYARPDLSWTTPVIVK